MATPEAAAVWLCSDAAAYVTGIALSVDGAAGVRIVAVEERPTTKKFLHAAHGLDVVPDHERHRHRNGPGIGEHRLR
ncbi:hypothetical protein GCM10017744_002480 [Streptomyces antimycoticus]|uniref:Uncharacterized protein n=1 Tax=Streptomyces antimycoticus TaxID=68175 RepID=A0A4D4KPL5_9ACTN|nr:hypothetical protein SANT12839_097180 [Streptomyces antimycoticus]